MCFRSPSGWEGDGQWWQLKPPPPPQMLLISSEKEVLRTSSKENLGGNKTSGFCSGFMGTFPLWGLLELVPRYKSCVCISPVTRPVICISLVMEAAWSGNADPPGSRQGDIYCEPGVLTTCVL